MRSPHMAVKKYILEVRCRCSCLVFLVLQSLEKLDIDPLEKIACQLQLEQCIGSVYCFKCSLLFSDVAHLCGSSLTTASLKIKTSRTYISHIFFICMKT